MFERLTSIATSLQEAAKAFVEHASSAEGQRQVELARLRGSRLVLLLGEIAQRTPRADGWMILSTAGQLIKDREPTELDGLLERYGHRTLKQLMVATGLFDIDDEPTPKGGSRTDLSDQPEVRTAELKGRPTRVRR